MTRVGSRLLMATAFVLGVALLTVAYGQPPESGRRGIGMMRGSFLDLLRVEQVQKELKLSEEQNGKVKEIGEKLREAMKEQFAGLREIQDRQQQRAKEADCQRLNRVVQGRRPA